MRATFFVLCLVLLMAVATPANAQLRESAEARQAPAQVYSENGLQVVFDKLFSPEHFRMQHSYEMSFSSFGGNSLSMGAYTNTMMWQFNDKLAARVDVSLIQPFSGFGEFGEQQPRLMLRNAEVAYRPTENMQFHFSVRQSPYGSYMSPYGYSPYYGRGYNAFDVRAGGMQPYDLFWDDNSRAQ